MTNLTELAENFKKWFSVWNMDDYRTWFDTQPRETIESEIMEFLENTHEETYSKNQVLSKQIYQELKIKEARDE